MNHLVADHDDAGLNDLIGRLVYRSPAQVRPGVCCRARGVISINALSDSRAAVQALVLTATMWIAGCGKEASPVAPTPSRTISGRITESMPTETTPVPGARVIIHDGPNAGKSATADSSGHYSIAGLVDSTFSLHAGAPGYLDRSGALVLTEDRILNIQIEPEPRTITETVTGTIENCNGEVYIICFSHRFYMHHAGPIEWTLTTTGKSESMRVHFYDVTRDQFVHYTPSQSPGTITVSFCTACPPAAYDFRVYGRIIGPVVLSARLTHPN
jgi:hypothetical protein